MKAFVEVRSQKSRGSGANKFGGPDTYFAVQIVPDGVERLAVLDQRIAKKLGIEIRYFGEGYRKHMLGNRSAYAKNLRLAQEFADEFNAAQPQQNHKGETPCPISKPIA